MLSLKRHNPGYLLLLVAVWGFLVLSRPLWFHAWCAQTPTPCVVSSVNSFDQIAFQFGLVRADFLSNVLQNSIGVLLFIFPWLLYRTSKFSDFKGPAWFETLLSIEVTFLNCVCLEIARLIVQRPRPLVFRSPLGDGANVNQYTSFYSGHTSFVALATLNLYFMVKRRFPHARWIRIDFLIVYISVCVLMGALRVIGGRHYPTDVIAGFMVGSLIALWANRSSGHAARS